MESKMTADAFADRLSDLIAEAQEGGVSIDDLIVAVEQSLDGLEDEKATIQAEQEE